MVETEFVVQVHYERAMSPIPLNVLTHRADNTTSCDTFLYDVKLAASGLRGIAQDVWTKETEGGRESFICLENGKNSYICGERKQSQEKIDFFSEVEEKRGKGAGPGESESDCK